MNADQLYQLHEHSTAYWHIYGVPRDIRAKMLRAWEDSIFERVTRPDPFFELLKKRAKK